MTSRQRILNALQHREPDRVPRDLGGTESSGMTALALHKLQTHLSLPGAIKVFEPYQYVAYINADLRQRFKIDAANLTPEPAAWTPRHNPAGFDVWLPQLWREDTAADGATVVLGADGRIVVRRPAGGFVFCQVRNILPALANKADAAL